MKQIKKKYIFFSLISIVLIFLFCFFYMLNEKQTNKKVNDLMISQSEYFEKIDTYDMFLNEKDNYVILRDEKDITFSPTMENDKLDDMFMKCFDISNNIEYGYINEWFLKIKKEDKNIYVPTDNNAKFLKDIFSLYSEPIEYLFTHEKTKREFYYDNVNYIVTMIEGEKSYIYFPKSFEQMAYLPDEKTGELHDTKNYIITYNEPNLHILLPELITVNYIIDK